MRPHWLQAARDVPPRGRAHRGARWRRAVYCIPRPTRAPSAPPGARASSPGHRSSRSGHARAWRVGSWIWTWRERERSRIRMNVPMAMRHGLHFSMQRERPRPHALHALIQEPRAPKVPSHTPESGEPFTHASSFNRTEPRRGAMARANHLGLRASGNRPCSGHLPEDGLILAERLHQLLGVAVLLLRLPARLLDVAT